MGTKYFLLVILLLLQVTFLQSTIFRTSYIKKNGIFSYSNVENVEKLKKLSLKNPQVKSRNLPTGSIRVQKSNGQLGDQLNNNNLTSYTLFVTTNQTCNSNLFGWFFENPNPSSPVLLWLQGGPGASSLFGLFEENGPFIVYSNLTVDLREFAWTNKYSMLYIDSPVGTGFSYTDNRTECYAHSLDQVSTALYTFLQAFFTYFDTFKSNDFYITGESYGGKYVSALAKRIIDNNEESSEFTNFKGIAIGNGWVDPVNQINTASLMYQIGLVDEDQRDNLFSVQNLAIYLINQTKWLDAFNTLNFLLDGDLGVKSLFNCFTGLNYYLNFLQTNEPSDDGYFIDYLNLPTTREAIGVGNLTFSDGSLVEYHLREDFAQSGRTLLEHVIQAGYKTLIYNGQLDIIVAPVVTENYLKVLNWSGQKKFQKAPKIIWKVNKNDTEVAGYSKQALNLQYVVVRNAGHMVPYDQPRAAYDLITQFVDSSKS